jgi:hypothetical protein
MTTFTGPVKSKGRDTRTRTGDVYLVQRATLAANNSAGAPRTISLPNPSDVIEFLIGVEIPFATAAGATACNVEISGAGGSTIAVVNVSASGVYRNGIVAGAAATMRNVTATIEAHVSIQGSPTAMNAGQAMLSVVYIDRTPESGL